MMRLYNLSSALVRTTLMERRLAWKSFRQTTHTRTHTWSLPCHLSPQSPCFLLTTMPGAPSATNLVHAPSKTTICTAKLCPQDTITNTPKLFFFFFLHMLTGIRRRGSRTKVTTALIEQNNVNSTVTLDIQLPRCHFGNCPCQAISYNQL